MRKILDSRFRGNDVCNAGELLIWLKFEWRF